MTITVRSVAAFACVLLSISSCSSCPSGPGSDDGGQGAEALRKVYAGLCGVLARCPKDSALSFAYRDSKECVDVLQFFTTCRLVESRDPAGGAVFGVEQLLPGLTPAEADACAAWLETAACEHVQSPCTSDGGCGPCGRFLAFVDDPSRATERPMAGLEELCDERTCADGLTCVTGLRGPNDAGEACHVCKPLRAAGGNCVDPPHIPCGAGLFCAADAGTCAPLLADGAGCLGSNECASGFCHRTKKTCNPGGRLGEACSATEDCREGLCDAAAGQCAPLLANGAPCSADTQCRTSLCNRATSRCGKPDGARCSFHGECQNGGCSAGVCAQGKAVGEPCTSDDACTSGLCHSGTCRVPCSAKSDCAAGEFCLSVDHLCHDTYAPGASCEAHEMCLTGFCNQARRCAVRPGLGDPCSGSSDCQPLAFCSGGVCKAFAPPGGACTTEDSCQTPFFCSSGTCTRVDLVCAPATAGKRCTLLQVCDLASYCDSASGSVCKPKKAAGSTCQRSSECPTSQFCERGTCIDWRREGESCEGQPCAPGLFCGGGFSARRCTKPLADGERCVWDSECQSQRCVYSSGSSYCGARACAMPPAGEVPPCHPKTCAEAGLSCGLLEDNGCSEWVACGTCSGHDTCGGGGKPGECGCTPQPVCGPRECATLDDGCGHPVLCNGGQCSGGTTCGGGGTDGVCGCPGDDVAGPRSATAGANFVADFSFVPWQDAERVANEDGIGALATLTQDALSGAPRASDYLVASGFGFALPETASVTSIEVKVVRKASLPDDIQDHENPPVRGRQAGGDGTEGQWDLARHVGDRHLLRLAVGPRVDGSRAQLAGLRRRHRGHGTDDRLARRSVA
ncbi:MAG: Dickkopf N-terminal cysteine-rich domain-containing protein [Myxococcales bacterium]